MPEISIPAPAPVQPLIDALRRDNPGPTDAEITQEQADPLYVHVRFGYAAGYAVFPAVFRPYPGLRIFSLTTWPDAVVIHLRLE